MSKLTLVSHELCPYVQRASIALEEKQVPFERVYIDLADKPAWFLAISPLGKVPLLKIEWPHRPDTILFESNVIVEFLEDVHEPRLHPSDPVERARHRAWMEFGSATLNAIGRLYSAPAEADLAGAADQLGQMFARLEDELGEHEWFGAQGFGMVDAVFGPVFRYFDVIDRLGAFIEWDAMPKTARWRRSLAVRPSVIAAVKPDYPAKLLAFIERRDSALGHRAREAVLAAS